MQDTKICWCIGEWSGAPLVSEVREYLSSCFRWHHLHCDLNSKDSVCQDKERKHPWKRKYLSKGFKAGGNKVHGKDREIAEVADMQLVLQEERVRSPKLPGEEHPGPRGHGEGGCAGVQVWQKTTGDWKSDISASFW